MPFTIPPILMEGDEPSKLPELGPGQKYDLGQAQGGEDIAPPPESGDLPDAYGTKELWAVARDPHTIYAHWDLTSEQLGQYKASAARGELVLRVHPGAPDARAVSEIVVEGDSRHLFAHVEAAGASYVIELGYSQPDGQWASIATSAGVTTPPETVAEDRSVTWVALDGTVVGAALSSERPSVRASERATPDALHAPTLPRSTAHPPRTIPLPPPAPAWVPDADLVLRVLASLPQDIQQELGWPPLPPPSADWTAQEECRLAGLIGLSLMRRSWPPSVELLDMISALNSPNLSSLGISSPSGADWGPKGFWFGIDAELVVYGATDPSATVTIAVQPIPLRPDGTFTCRFALPEGAHALPARAVSSQGEVRQINLKFTRQTSGET